MMSYIVECEQVGMQFSKQKQPILEKINLQIQKGEFVSIIGKSGSGKTTLLQLIAGLMKPTTGTVKIAGNVLTELRDEVTYVFQKPVLLEWRNVLENVLLPIELKRKPTTQDVQKAKDIIASVGLSGHETKYPHELSGGMMSRVSLARGFMTEPRILLMDEPFSALDAMTKEQLHLELLDLIERFSTTVLFITHDITEAVYLSDRVVLFGRKPSKIVEQFFIPFSRPRDVKLKFQSDFTQVVQQIYERIEKESR